MTTTPRSLFGRDDTMLGVCQGLGEDLGIHPNILRIAFAVALMVQPMAVVATYLGLGLVLAAARRIWPASRRVEPAPVAAAIEPNEKAEPDSDAAVEAENKQLELAEAA